MVAPHSFNLFETYQFSHLVYLMKVRLCGFPRSFPLSSTISWPGQYIASKLSEELIPAHEFSLYTAKLRKLCVSQNSRCVSSVQVSVPLFCDSTSFQLIFGRRQQLILSSLLHSKWYYIIQSLSYKTASNIISLLPFHCLVTRQDRKWYHHLSFHSVAQLQDSKSYYYFFYILLVIRRQDSKFYYYFSLMLTYKTRQHKILLFLLPLLYW